MKKDLVSIIITSYNSKELLIESVNSALNQSHKNIEIMTKNIEKHLHTFRKLMTCCLKNTSKLNND